MDSKNFGDNEVRLPDIGNSKPAERAAETIQEMKQEVGKYVDTAKERVNELRDEAKDRMTEFTDEAKAQGDKAIKRAQKTYERLDDYAHKNPWHVVGIAAAVGAVVAALLVGGSCRRRDE